MAKVKNIGGCVLDFSATVQFMNDDIRENLHSKLAPCSEQRFFTAYERVHKKFFKEVWELSKSNPVW